MYGCGGEMWAVQVEAIKKPVISAGYSLNGQGSQVYIYLSLRVHSARADADVMCR